MPRTLRTVRAIANVLVAISILSGSLTFADHYYSGAYVAAKPPLSESVLDGPGTSPDVGPLPFDEPSVVPTSGTYFESQGMYIDGAMVNTQLRFRFDAAYGFENADRAEFFYSTWEEFGGTSPASTIGPNNNVDSQSFWFSYEQLLTHRLSAFVETSVLLNNPSGVPGPQLSVNNNHGGLGDTRAGIKYVLWEGCDDVLTFQLKNYIPTGDQEKWLTAGHYSIEPGLLYMRQINACWQMEAELRDWIPIGGAVNPNNRANYAGNVIRYGLGFSYNWIEQGEFEIRPVAEFVGWTVLDGQKFAFTPSGAAAGPRDATNDTIVNAKVGLRVNRSNGASFGIGYGRGLTGDVWYQDILRVEYRQAF